MQIVKISVSPASDLRIVARLAVIQPHSCCKIRYVWRRLVLGYGLLNGIFTISTVLRTYLSVLLTQIEWLVAVFSWGVVPRYQTTT